LRDVIHGGGLHTALGEQLGRRVDQRPAGVRLFAFAYAHLSPPRGVPDPLGQVATLSACGGWRIGDASIDVPDAPGTTTPTEPDEDDMEFSAIVDELLAGYFRHYPVQATEIGHHAHDGVWPDLTDGGRAARLAWATDASARVEALAPDALSRDEAIDRPILRENLHAIRFSEETLDEG